MANTTKSTKKSTPKSTPKKAGTKTARNQEVVKASSAKALNGNGKAKASTTKLRDLLVKTWPKFPSMEELMKAVPGTAKNRILMYKGATDRCMKAAQRVGRLAK